MIQGFIRFTFVLSAIIILTSSALLAAINIESINGQNTVAEPAFAPTAKNIAYTITIPGKEYKGKVSADKIFLIERLDTKDYLPMTFHVKTKSRLDVSKDGKAISSHILQNSIKDLNIKEIYPIAGENPGDKILSNDKYGVTRIYEIRYDSPVDPYDVCIDLMNNPDVEYAVPVFKRYTYSFTPNDPDFSKQYGLQSMKLEQAWDFTRGSKDVLIAIIDSGTEITHSDLAANIWTNPGEIPDNGIDDDGNGKIDDVNGWDFVGNVTINQIYSGIYKEDNNPVNNAAFHGTFVAGCASAATHNNNGIASPGFSCSLLPVKCASDQYADGIFRGYSAIIYAARTGADIINCSWGGPGSSPAEQDIINQATELGSLVVVASGNDGMNIDDGGQYPAGYDNVLSVGATRTQNRLASFSNTGFSVAVYAPGESIYSTTLNNRYSTQSGTSFSSPYTSGVAGLIKSLHPEYTPKQIWHQLRGSVDNVITSNPNLRHLYFGQVNAFQAVYKNFNDQTPQMPGIEATEVLFSGTPYLNDYLPKELALTISNFLADAKNLKVTLQNLSRYIRISKNNASLGTLSTNEEKTIDLQITLLDNNPWYEGSANILLTFEADGYFNQQVIKVPIRVPSKNKFTTAVSFPESYTPQWFYAHAPNPNTFWAIASGGFFGNNFGAMRMSGGQEQYINIPNYSYTVFAFDGMRAFTASSPQGSGSSINYTSNAGATWSGVSVGSYCDFINQIHFFDENNGIFLGDVKGGRFGIGKTNNGGGSWTQVINQTNPVTGESGWVGSTYWLGNNGWFGTTKGRVYRTSNRGDVWQASPVYSGGHVYYIGFKDPMNGIAVYAEQEQGTELKLAATTNGGSTWTPNIYNFTANGLRPVYVFAPTDSKMIYVQHIAGEIYGTSDNGKTWIPALTLKTGLFTVCSGVTMPQQQARIWDFGAGAGYLDFYYPPVNEIKDFTMQISSPLDFGTVAVDKSSIKSVPFTNNSNVPIKIISSEIISEEGASDGEFSFVVNPPDEVPVGNNLILRIRFLPKSIGEKKAKMKVVVDMEQNNTFEIELTGVGSQSSGIDYKILQANSSISPNPNQGIFNLSFGLKQTSTVNIVIYDDLGNRKIEINKGLLTLGEHNLPLNLSTLSSGTYFYEVNAGIEKITGSFVVVK